MQQGSYMLFLLHLVVGAVCASEEYRCPEKAMKDGILHVFKGKCYQFVDSEREWPEARDFCKNNGGHLLEIRDLVTQKWVYYILTEVDPMRNWGRNGMWLGAHDRHAEGKYEWDSDGQPVEWAYWKSGQPSCCHEDCATFRIDDGGRWHDKLCTSIFTGFDYIFTCQYALGPPTTTTTTTLSTTTVRQSTKIVTSPTTTHWNTTTSGAHVESTSNSIIYTETSTFYEQNNSLHPTTEAVPVSTTNAERSTQGVSTQRSVAGKQTAQDDKLSEGALVGLVVMSCFIFILFIFLLVCFLVVRRRKSKADPASFVNKMYGMFRKAPRSFTRPVVTDQTMTYSEIDAHQQENNANENAMCGNTCSKELFENPYDQIPADMGVEGPCGYSTCEESPYDEPKLAYPYDTPIGVKDNHMRLGETHEKGGVANEPQKAAASYLTPVDAPDEKDSDACSESDSYSNREIATLDTPIRAKSNEYSDLNITKNIKDKDDL